MSVSFPLRNMQFLVSNCDHLRAINLIISYPFLSQMFVWSFLFGHSHPVRSR